jgi:hypothetical protein
MCRLKRSVRFGGDEAAKAQHLSLQQRLAATKVDLKRAVQSESEAAAALAAAKAALEREREREGDEKLRLQGTRGVLRSAAVAARAQEEKEERAAAAAERAKAKALAAGVLPAQLEQILRNLLVGLCVSFCCPRGP